jgi:hypothetical protein
MNRTANWIRRGFLVLLVVLMPRVIAAQQSERPESAISKRAGDYGGYVELDTRFGDMMGGFAGFAGARAALRLKQQIYVGLGGLGLATDNARVAGLTPGTTHRLHMGYGGFLIGYAVPTKSLVDFTADALVGAGGVRISGLDQRDEFFLFEPSLGVELRLAPVVRLGLGGGYRFVGGLDLPGVRDADLRGFTGTASIRVGWF